MGTNKYTCNQCGRSAYIPKSGPCRYGCGGDMDRLASAKQLEAKCCVMCGKGFTPKTQATKCCSPECSLEYSRMTARERQRSSARGERFVTPSNDRPWSWLEFRADESLRCTVKLVCNTHDVEYPWVDVLSGNAPAWSANY